MSRQLSLFSHDPWSPAEISGGTGLGATLDFFADYLHAEGKSIHTVKAFRGDLKLLVEFAGYATPIGQIRSSDLNAFLDWMENDRGLPCSRKTYARRVTSLKVYFKWLCTINALAGDPAQAVRQRSGPAPMSDVLTARNLLDCIAVARMIKKGGTQDYRAEFLFQLLLGTGIKKAETGRLKLADITHSDSSASFLYIRHQLRDVYKERRIRLEADLLELFEQYRQQYQLDDRVFTCTTRNLEYILTDIGQRSRVPFKLSFEVMRWTMAVRDYQLGADEEALREKMGLSRTSWYETSDKIKRLAAGLQEASSGEAASEDS